MNVRLRYKSLRSKRITVVLDVYKAKRDRRRESLGIYIEPTDSKEVVIQKKELAEKIKAKRLLELASEQFGIPSAARRKESFIDYFKAQMNKKAFKTKENWNSVLVHLTDYKGTHVTFADVTDKWLEAFREYLLSQNLSVNTSIAYLDKVRTTLNKAVRDNIIPYNPAHRLESVRREESEKVYLTVEELQMIANTPCDDEIVKKAFLFSCYTGLRVSDIKALKWEQLKKEKIDNKDVYVLKFKQKKTKDINYLPLNNTALALMGRAKNDDEYVFDLSTHNRSISRTLGKIAKKAGIKRHIWFHCGRHTHAVMLLANGADLYTVSKILGHRDIKSTQVYAKVIDDTKIKAISNLPTLSFQNQS